MNSENLEIYQFSLLDPIFSRMALETTENTENDSMG